MLLRVARGVGLEDSRRGLRSDIKICEICCMVER